MKLGKLIRIANTFVPIPGVRSTYRPKVGPLSFNTSAQKGLSSVSVGVGPFRSKIWDRNGNTGLSSIDLPGPLSYRPTSNRGRDDKRSGPATMNPNGSRTE